jgi:ABC-type antimicrobial peptide transport system permease subunit
LIVAGVGLFGLLNHYVATRRTEIGIRVAVGAGTRDIARLLVGEVAGLFVVGCLSGTLMLLIASRTFAALLFGVVPNDPWLLSMTLAIIGAIALLALWLPLRRATSLDPLVALKAD